MVIREGIKSHVIDTAVSMTITLTRLTVEGVELVPSTEWFVVVQREAGTTLER